MILLIDTSTSTCNITLYEAETVLIADTWEAGRSLAEKIFSHLEELFSQADKSWDDLTGIGLFQGPGSFTGLRIGAAVMNALADDKSIPIVGVTGDDWQQQALIRLKDGNNDTVVMPEYGREACITKPRK